MTRPRHEHDALIAMAAEPLRRRRGVYVRSSQIADRKAQTFRFAAIERLCARGEARVQPRVNPRRIEATLTVEGRATVARILSRQAEALLAAADAELGPA